MAGTVSSLLNTTAVCPPSATALSSSHSSVYGAGFASVTSVGGRVLVSSTPAVRCRISAEQDEHDASLSRRSAFSLLAAVGALGFSRVSPAIAVYGEGANIFGSPKASTGFTTYAGDGFSFNLPAKWNPSKEVEFPGQVLRYEDNFDPLTNLSVSIRPSDKRSIKEYGSPESFLKTVSYLLGKQSYKGQTVSEGGFDPNLVASASIFKAEEADVKGKPYYYLAVLTRTGDGTEGGRHQYIVSTVAGGKLYIFKAQAGDKRWFKGTNKFVEGAASSFTVV